MLTFSLPRIITERLARLHLACDTIGNLAHIHLRVTASHLRFTATNGKLLVCLRHEPEDLQGSPADLILNGEQFTAAMKAAAKSAAARIAFSFDKQEARITYSPGVSLVRRVECVYPAIDQVFSRTVGSTWVPATASFCPTMLATAQKIVGKASGLLLSSPVTNGSLLKPLWESPVSQASVPTLASLQALMRAPGYWCDGEMALLLMPITRADVGRAFDLEPFTSHAMERTAQAA